MPRETNDAKVPPQPGGTPAPRQAAPLLRGGRLGLWLFLVYLAFYGGFMLANAFAADWMAREFVAGLNLAVVYGMALIVVALLLALLYCWLCRTDAEPGNASPSPPSRGAEVENAENSP